MAVSEDPVPLPHECTIPFDFIAHRHGGRLDIGANSLKPTLLDGPPTSDNDDKDSKHGSGTGVVAVAEMLVDARLRIVIT